MSELKNINTNVDQNVEPSIEEVREQDQKFEPRSFDLIGDTKTSVKPKYHCTLVKFACYAHISYGKQNQIIKNRKNTSDGGYPWYHDTKRYIKKSIISNSLAPIYEGISYLENKKPDTSRRYDAPNIEHSKKALKKYLEVKFPIEFKQLKKTLFSPSKKSFLYSNIDLSMFGIHFFKGYYKGENIIGGIHVNCTKSKMTKRQMEVTSYLMKTFISDNLCGDNEVCLPKFCITIDINSKMYVTSPSGTDEGKIRVELSKTCQAFSERWDSL